MVYVNRFTYPLPIVEVRRREKRGEGGRVEKNGGGAKLERGETRKILSQRGGGWGRQGVGDTSLQCKYSDPLNSPKLFFRFVLADFTLLTWNSKKNVHIFL